MTAEPHLSIGRIREHRRYKSAASSCTARGMEPRRGTPGVVMWPDFQSDARPLDTGLAPRRNTEGGIQPADKSLINRRLKRAPSPALCRFFHQTKASTLCGTAARGVCCSVGDFSLDNGHKRLLSGAKIDDLAPEPESQSTGGTARAYGFGHGRLSRNLAAASRRRSIKINFRFDAGLSACAC